MPDRRRPYDPLPRGCGQRAVAFVVAVAAAVLVVAGGALSGRRRT